MSAEPPLQRDRRAAVVRRLSRGARVAVVATSFWLGALLAIGCVIAAMLEADGFGRRGADPRWWYIASLAAGLVASVGVPFVLLRVLLPEHARRAWPAFGIALVVAFLLFGLAIRP